jgi:cell division protein FtsB
MRALIAVLLVLLLVLQFKLWFGDGGLAELRERNAALEAEVTDLRQGLAAIEERARSELGMVVRGETFYQLVEEPPPPPVEAER